MFRYNLSCEFYRNRFQFQFCIYRLINCIFAWAFISFFFAMLFCLSCAIFKQVQNIRVDPLKSPLSFIFQMLSVNLGYLF